MTKTHCPNGHWLNVADSLVGKKGKCPKCGMVFVIAAENVADSDSPPHAASRSGNAPVASNAPVSGIAPVSRKDSARPPRPEQPERAWWADPHTSTPQARGLQQDSTRSGGHNRWTLLFIFLSGVLSLSTLIAGGLYFTRGWRENRPAKPDGIVANSGARTASRPISQTQSNPGSGAVSQPNVPQSNVSQSNLPRPVMPSPSRTAATSRRRSRRSVRSAGPGLSTPAPREAIYRPQNAIEVKALQLPEPFEDTAADRFALNPETGDLAAILAKTGQFFLFRHDDLARGNVQPAVTTQVGAIPDAICFKRFGDLSLFAVFCSRDRHIFLIDAASGALFKKIDVGDAFAGSFFAAASSNPHDPFVYFSYGARYGGLNLRTMQLFPPVIQNVNDFAVSAGGKYLYMRGAYSPSGITSLVRLNDLDEDKPEFTELFHEHVFSDPYVPDPFERFTAVGLTIYSATLIRDELRTRGVGCAPQCFFRKRPVMIGLPAHAWRDRNPASNSVLYAASYNTLATCGIPIVVVASLSAVSNGPVAIQYQESSGYLQKQTPLLFADDQHDCVVFARFRNVAVIPLEKFQIPDEPLLNATLEGPQRVKFGEECALTVKVADPRVKVAFDRLPDGMKADGLNLSWRPTDLQLGPAKIMLSLKYNNLERSQEFEIQVDRPAIELPFRPDDLTVETDGKRAAIWEISRAHPARRPLPNESSHRPIRLALVDLESGKTLGRREIEGSVQQVAFMRDRLVLVTATWNVPQDHRFPVQQELSCEICRLPDLSTERTLAAESPIRIAQVVGQTLAIETDSNMEIYTLDSFERVRTIKRTPSVALVPPMSVKEGLFMGGVVYGPDQKPVLIARADDFASLNGADFLWRPQSAAEPKRHRFVPLIGGDVHRLATEMLPDANVRVSLDMRVEGLPWGPITRGQIHVSERLVEVSLTASESTDARWIVARQVFLRPSDNFRPRLAVAPGKAIVVFERQLFRLPVKAGSATGPSNQPLAFVERQSAFTLNPSGKTVLTHVVQGGKPPYRFLLVDRLMGAQVDEKQGIVTIDRAPLLPALREAVKGAVGRLNRGEPYVDTFEAWSQKVIGRASEILGRKPAGIPVAIPICLNVEDADSNSARLQYFVLAELAKSELASIPQELEKDRGNNRFRPMVTSPQGPPAKRRPFAHQGIVTTIVQPESLTQPATAAQTVDVHRVVRDAIGVLEGGDVVKFYEVYGPVDQFRALRDRGLLKSNPSSPLSSPDTTRSLIEALKPFRNGEVRVDQEGLFARVTSPAENPETANAEPESPNPLAAVSSPKDGKIALVGYGDDLSQVLKAGLAALESGQIESFIDHLFPAGELGRLEANHGKAKLIARLKKQPELIEQMRRDLKAGVEAPTEFNAAKTLASITLPAAADDPVPAPRIVKFQKVAGSWRFFDNSTPVREEMVRQSRLVPPKLSYPVSPGEMHALLLEKIGSNWRILRMPKP